MRAPAVSPRSLTPVLVLGLGLALAASVTAPACSKSGGGGAAGHDRTLRVSMIPTTAADKMLRESEPLKAYLEQATGAKVELTIPLNYAAVVEAFGADKVDIAYFGGFTYIQARKRFDAQPLVQRDRDQQFHSLFVTPAGSPIASLADLAGKRFAFGDVNSTSGHLMPEYFMRQQGVAPEVIAKATYTGGHDATALAVANAKVDAGALDEAVYARLIKDGKLDAAALKVFYTTPPFFDYVWAARKALDPALTEGFRRAMLALDAGNPQHKPVLDLLQATHYVAADDASYGPLREAATTAGLLK